MKGAACRGIQEGIGTMVLSSLLVSTVLSPAQASDPPIRSSLHPFYIEQPASAPQTLVALIEIPKGSRTKYEIDPITGYLVVDRILPETVTYPAHYGGLPSWWASDGDLMDVLVISEAQFVPMAFVTVIPLGVAQMRDGGEIDDKVIAIPVSEVSIYADGELDLDSIDPKQLQAIEQFFRTYKVTENGVNPIEWMGFQPISSVIRQWCDRPTAVKSPTTCLPPASGGLEE